MRRARGSPTTKAWLSGWDAATAGLPLTVNLYKREPQVRAWERGWWTGYWAEDSGVRVMKRKVNEMHPGTYPKVN